jgi:hypothetical protein
MFLAYPTSEVLGFEYVLKPWSPGGDAVLEGAGNFRRWGLA